MQRSLLPRARPQLAGLEVGDVYESSARVDVGGDVYDFLELADGRLAVVLGDVTGHGIDAAADMAMAKFVFRSLAREHLEPGGLPRARRTRSSSRRSRRASSSRCSTSTVDARNGERRVRERRPSAPRLVVRRTARVEPLAVGGLALGIDGGQHYEEARVRLEPGDAVVLFTDGVRRGAPRRRALRRASGSTHALPPNAGPAGAGAGRGAARRLPRLAAASSADDCAIVVAQKRT